ncbi:hypothetical protein ACFSL6_18460 [Paenibacillus thailandensis]|uniref:Uncharacterized protein n=1 Tax=Paenibacillus thailandensis TaxID=393250 RepID=A0ABW5QS25_9BACL
MFILLAYAFLLAIGFSMLVIADLITGQTVAESLKNLIVGISHLTSIDLTIMFIVLTMPLIPAVKSVRKRRQSAQNK